MLDLLQINPKGYIKKRSPDLNFEEIANSNILARPWLSYPTHGNPHQLSTFLSPRHLNNELSLNLSDSE